MTRPKCNPIPTFDDLGLSNTPGIVYARVIELASEGMDPFGISKELTEFAVPLEWMEKWISKGSSQIQRCRSFSGDERNAYLNGLAVLYNRALNDVRLLRQTVRQTNLL